jgi:N-acetylneuraminic acid mutarotase
MKIKTIIFFLFFLQIIQAQLNVTEVANLPVKVSNNAVCEGFIDKIPYVFSFAGIDSTKLYSGIHLKSYRYNTITHIIERLPDLPDKRGKIACAASRIDTIIYISGGYHVYKNHSEVSSNKMHRYDIKNNSFLKDAKDIPVATDDHVQVVWQQKLIYLITGWSNKENIPNVQIYNPKLDTWLIGTATPNESSYKSFGASGTIVGNTIYYFGGATSDKGFHIQNQLRMGKINPKNPTEIDWSIVTPNQQINGYRMACVNMKKTIHWIGGSTNTYNYDGIAYDKSGGVSPNNRDLFTCNNNIKFKKSFVKTLPMDLRGAAKTNKKTVFLVGGMIENQQVSNKILKLEW